LNAPGEPDNTKGSQQLESISAPVIMVVAHVYFSSIAFIDENRRALPRFGK
jgi:hypothetical protein